MSYDGRKMTVDLNNDGPHDEPFESKDWLLIGEVLNVLQVSRRRAFAVVALIWAGATAFNAFFILTTTYKAARVLGEPIPFSWRLRNVLVAQLGPLSFRWPPEPGAVLVCGLLLAGSILLAVRFRSWIIAWIPYVLVVLLWHLFALAVWGTSIT